MSIHQNPVYISSISHTCYMLRPSHSSRFDNPKNIGWGLQIINLPIMQSSPLPFYLVTSQVQISSSAPILERPRPTFLPQLKRPSFTLIQSNSPIIVLSILIFIFLDSKMEDKIFCIDSFPDFLGLYISVVFEGCEYLSSHLIFTV
jgi:hypothetical protein